MVSGQSRPALQTPPRTAAGAATALDRFEQPAKDDELAAGSPSDFRSAQSLQEALEVLWSAAAAGIGERVAGAALQTEAALLVS